jgi:hypothetical protein
MERVTMEIELNPDGFCWDDDRNRDAYSMEVEEREVNLPLDPKLGLSGA